jgi:hypothetical protein
MSPSSTTQLASGVIDGGDQLQVILVTRYGRPPIVQLLWPSRPTVVTPAAYPQTAATITRLISESAIALARWKAYGR